jgi:hypothetical protein
MVAVWEPIFLPLPRSPGCGRAAGDSCHRRPDHLFPDHPTHPTIPDAGRF